MGMLHVGVHATDPAQEDPNDKPRKIRPLLNHLKQVSK